MKLTLKEANGNFFDRQSVISATDTATRQVLSRFGAFVRTRARTSIRKRKGTSKPGSPPYSHGQHLLRNFILFAYDRQQNSVVIGPTLINKPTGAPETLEFGGSATLPRWFRGKAAGKRVRIAARPYMRPALDAELPRLPQMFRDKVKGR